MRKNIFIVLFCLFFIFVREVSAENKHIVKNGDTLWKLSQQYQVSLKWIIKNNPSVNNPDLIFPGQEIVIPDHLQNAKEKNLQSYNESRLLTLINEERAKIGLNQLQYDGTLSNAAQLKSIDMKNNGYIAHNSPTYGNASSMLKEFNISFRLVKESVGAGHHSADEIFSSWLNSSVNRVVVLNEEATHIGIGYTTGGIHGHYWTIFVIKK